MNRRLKKAVALILAFVIIISSILFIMSDSDYDGLLDVYENWIGTSPRNPDTDGDGLEDYEEVYEAKDGYKTNPLERDSDFDGLTDYEETQEFETDPNSIDTDGDGARDSIDMTPNGFPNFDWRTRFDPGLIRFSLPLEVYSLKGLYAQKWTWDFLSGSCRFVSDDTEGATKSSRVTPKSVIESVNLAMKKEGKDVFRAVDARYIEERYAQYMYMEYGPCEFLRPHRYKIAYAIRGQVYQVSFMNSLPSEIRDSNGAPYWLTYERIPIEIGKKQIISLQFHLAETFVSSPSSSSANQKTVGFILSVYPDYHFRKSPPMIQKVVPGVFLGDAVYQVDLDIDANVATWENSFLSGGGFSIVFVLTPIWIQTRGERTVFRAIDPSAFNMVALNRRYTSKAVSIIARQGISLNKIDEAIPHDISSYPPGLYRFGSFDICIRRSHSLNYCNQPEDIDVIAIVSSSIDDLEEIKNSIDWGQPGIWYEDEVDEFGNVLRTFNAMLDVLEIDHQLYRLSRDSKSFAATQRPRVTEITYLIVHIRKGMDGQKVYNSFQADMLKKQEWEGNGGVKRVFIRWRMKSMDTARDPEKSSCLEGLGSSLKSSLKVAKIGTIFVSNGREAWLAYRSGDVIQGSLFIAKGGVDSFSVVDEDRTIGSLGVGLRILRNVPAARLAKFILGALSNAYVLSKLRNENNEFTKQVLISQIHAGTVDLVLLVVLGQGAFYLGWSVGLAIMSTILLNDLAATIVSSPGSFLTFAWIYLFSDKIPAEIAQDALSSAIQTAVELAEEAIARGRLSVVVLP